jgi:hypothetical protein
MYLVIASVWCRALSRTERRKHPLGPYVLGRGFVVSVARASVDGMQVASVCARLACRHVQARGEPLPLDHPPEDALDPATVWWCPIDGSSGLGVHYVELGGGTLEFLSVAPIRR